MAGMAKSTTGAPSIGLSGQLDPEMVAEGIRAGMAEVLPLRTDPKPAVTRILSWLGETSVTEPSAEEMAEVEEMLDQLESPDFKPAADSEVTTQRERMWRGLRELHLEREIATAVRLNLDEHARLLA